MTYVVPPCVTCRNLPASGFNKALSCAAYPERIPQAIFDGEDCPKKRSGEPEWDGVVREKETAGK